MIILNIIFCVNLKKIYFDYLKFKPEFSADTNKDDFVI